MAAPLLAALLQDRIRVADVQTVSALASMCVATGVPITAGDSILHFSDDDSGAQNGSGQASDGPIPSLQLGSIARGRRGLLSLENAEQCLWCIGVYAQVLFRWGLVHTRAHLLKLAERMRASVRLAIAERTGSNLRSTDIDTHLDLQATHHALAASPTWGPYGVYSSRKVDPGLLASTLASITDRTSASIAEEENDGSSESDRFAGDIERGDEEIVDALNRPSGPFDQAAPFCLEVYIAPAAPLIYSMLSSQTPSKGAVVHKPSALRMANDGRQSCNASLGVWRSGPACHAFSGCSSAGAVSAVPTMANAGIKTGMPTTGAGLSSVCAEGGGSGGSSLFGSSVVGARSASTLKGASAPSTSRSLNASPAQSRALLGLGASVIPHGAAPVTHCPVAYTTRDVEASGSAAPGAKGRRGLGVCSTGSQSCGACLGSLGLIGGQAGGSALLGNRCSAFGRIGGTTTSDTSSLSERASANLNRRPGVPRGSSSGGDAFVPLTTSPLCAVCMLPVRGVAWSCGACGHGGHWPCLREWLAESLAGQTNGARGQAHNRCPTGCGCECGNAVSSE